MSEFSGIVGISVVKNESDIIEPMVRHNLLFLDHLIVIDNNSGDATSDIAGALSAEFSDRFISKRDLRTGHVQTEVINETCRALASQRDIACFIPLDADEFILAEREFFRMQLLSEKRPILLPWVTYVPSRQDDQSDPNPATRIKHRRREEVTQYYKTTLPRHLVKKTRIGAGNHSLDRAWRFDPQVIDGLSLAHFPIRSKHQLWSKAVIGALNMRLGDRRKGEGFQWHDLAEKISNNGGISDDDYFQEAKRYAISSDVELIEDPLAMAPEACVLRYPVDNEGVLAVKLTAFAKECVDLLGGDQVKENVAGQAYPPEAGGVPEKSRANRDAKGRQRPNIGRSIFRGLGYELVRSGNHMEYVNSIHKTNSSFGPLLFAVHNRRDVIQSYHYRGEVYEPEELDIIQKHYDGGHFLDIGANVGNHTVCIGSLDRTETVTAIEPNPDTLLLLAQNVALNGLWRKTNIHNVALSDTSGRGTLAVPSMNTGGASLSAPRGSMDVESSVGVVLEKGDELFASSTVDFVKIDVEGHEIACLNGLRKTILANKPPVFIEVANEDRAGLEQWFQEIGYDVVADFRRYPETINLLYRPSN